MLPDNGRLVRQRKNLFMSLTELEQLLKYLQEYYDPKWRLFILIQFSLGMRCSETSAINIKDFSKDYHLLNYRQSKTNKMIYNEPVPGPVAEEIKSYVRFNAYRLKDGFFFCGHKGQFYNTETIGAFWTKWRKGCAKEYNSPNWLDAYPTKCGVKYRISSHSLRRLHRTYLAKILNNDYLTAKLCHYNDVKTLSIYRDEFELLEKRDKIILPVMEPIMASLIKCKA